MGMGQKNAAQNPTALTVAVTFVTALKTEANNAGTHLGVSTAKLTLIQLPIINAKDS